MSTAKKVTVSELPVRRTVNLNLGNDGLTDAERHESAERWRNGAGRTPTRDEMDEIRRLTPVTHKAAENE